jgi:hypothetical protein
MRRQLDRRRRQSRRRRLTAHLIFVVSVAVLTAAAISGDGGNARRTDPDPPFDAGGRALGRTLIRPGSRASALPGNVLIADRSNNRLIEVNPRGRIVWRFPVRRNQSGGNTFKVPDDAFFTPNGRYIVATQEDDFVISVIDVANQRIVYRYGRPGDPGSGPNRLHNPDDALWMGGRILTADIKNCRLLVLRPPSHRPVRQLGASGLCAHNPPFSFSSPNGAFPTRGGGTIVTEINGDWVDLLSRSGQLMAATNPPGFSYPSDTNQVRRNVFLSSDYTRLGAIETFTSTGKLIWRFAPRGRNALDRPSLALPLPNGDILANDDHNDRVIVVDPRSNRIVWQYGHTGRPGRRAGYLNLPDGVDLAPPHSLLRGFPRAHAPP